LTDAEPLPQPRPGPSASPALTPEALAFLDAFRAGVRELEALGPPEAGTAEAPRSVWLWLN